MWVVTDEDNEALATYEGAGATPEHGRAVLVWTF
jgi:hypothetical protein